MTSTNAALAAHFRTKRRVPGAPGAEADARTAHAQHELRRATEDDEKVAFRFDFDLGHTDSVGDLKKKRKNKKKKKKKTKASVISDVNGGGTGGGDGRVQPEVAEHAREGGEPTAPTKPANASTKKKKKKKTKSNAPTQAQETSDLEVKAAAPLEVATAMPPAPVVKDLPPPPGFLKLRKPTSSDSEVMKMQLRYGRGKRNAAAIALREKQKQSAAVPPSSASSDDAAGFQFNFY